MGEPAVAGAGRPDNGGRIRRVRRRRVFVEDVRRDGHYLRATWHPDRRVFVVSTWHNEVCTGAIQMPVEETGDLAGLIIDGLADALVTTGPTPPRRWEVVRRRVREQILSLRRRLARTASPVQSP